MKKRWSRLPEAQARCRPGARASTRLRRLWLALTALPGLLRSPAQRRLLAEMRALSRRLPHLLQQPLPQAMQALAPLARGRPDCDLPADDVRRLADLAALLARRSPLGYCLRRSLLRYHFLNRAGLPLGVAFGARLRQDPRQQESGAPTIAGHAWVTLNGEPYQEADEHWRNFQVIYRWPAEE